MAWRAVCVAHWLRSFVRAALACRCHGHADGHERAARATRSMASTRVRGVARAQPSRPPRAVVPCCDAGCCELRDPAAAVGTRTADRPRLLPAASLSGDCDADATAATANPATAGARGYPADDAVVRVAAVGAIADATRTRVPVGGRGSRRPRPRHWLSHARERLDAGPRRPVSDGCEQRDRPSAIHDVHSRVARHVGRLGDVRRPQRIRHHRHGG